MLAKKFTNNEIFELLDFLDIAQNPKIVKKG